MKPMLESVLPGTPASNQTPTSGDAAFHIRPGTIMPAAAAF
jgi:hypothetical protein